MCILGKQGSDSLIIGGNGSCSFSKLCDDLVVEILCRLPAENLIRCKCVCKSWNRLITDVCVPKFSASLPLRGFFYQGEVMDCARCKYYPEYVSCDAKLQSDDARMVESLSTLLPFEFTSKDLIDSCNGLLLFVMGSVPQYYVCNPLTKQCIEIPRNFATAVDAFCSITAVGAYMKKRLSSNAALAFNPCESSHYKLVTFNHWSICSVNNTVNIDVFSSETGVWVNHTMPLESKDPIVGSTWINRVVYLCGVLYRLSRSKHLIRLNLNELNAQATELPKRDTTRFSGFIGASKGCLHYSSSDASTLFVWFLENDGKAGRWVLKHSICINNLGKYKLSNSSIDCPPRDAFSESWVLDPISYGMFFGFKAAAFRSPWALDPNSEAIFFGLTKAVFKYQVDKGAMELIHFISMDSKEEIYPLHRTIFTYSACPMALKGFPSTLQVN